MNENIFEFFFGLQNISNIVYLGHWIMDMFGTNIGTISGSIN